MNENPSPYMTIPPLIFYIFSEPPKLLARLFWQYLPSEIAGKHKNKQHFYKQHHTEI